MSPLPSTFQNPLPVDLASAVAGVMRRFADAAGEDGAINATDLDGIWAESQAGVWASSPFVAQACVSDPSILGRLDVTDPVETRLAAVIDRATDEQDLGVALRRFRRAEMARIAWRDLARVDDLDATLTALSALAVASVELSLTRLIEWQCAQWQIKDGAEIPELVTLAMGKLGAAELNFSSDIDLMFFIQEDGDVPSDRPGTKTWQQFYNKVIQSFVKLLSTPTPEGFVFRVDTRLRPFGSAGPLVISFDAAENYYQTVGRDWERYALIKALPVSGSPTAREALMASLKPFVYRRYVDFTVVDALRSMKASIEQEVQRKGLHDDVKRGAGGIREIEFIGQAFQLIHGGRDPDLQTRSIRRVLALLGERGTLAEHTVTRLDQAYVFLRLTENHIQEIGDQQTHRLPRDSVDKQRLALSMDFVDWDSFLGALERHRAFVSDQFNALFSAPQRDGANDPMHARLVAIWRQLLDREQDDDGEIALIDGRRELLMTLLEELGFGADDCEVHDLLLHFSRQRWLQSVGQGTRDSLDRLMPLLIRSAAGTSNPLDTLQRLLGVIESIAGRATYFELLVDNPLALSQLTRLVSASPFIAQTIGKLPVLLDTLLDPRSLYAAADRNSLREDLQQRLRPVDDGDVEAEMDVLRQFKQAGVLQVAAAEVAQLRPLMQVSDGLSEIAELVLENGLRLAWRDIASKYGEPTARLDGADYQPGFGIIAYGKLGGLELGHTSDLDLVFLNDSAGSAQQTNGERSIDNSVFFTRVGQRLMSYLTTRTGFGQLYEIDMRLRPNGNSGLLVSAVGAFESYQREKAWTWEHQALVRARFVAGEPRVGAAFDAIRKSILCTQRDPQALRAEVVKMRARMRSELGDKRPGCFDLKHAAGGIVDIEFMVQYGVLAWAAKHPELAVWSDNVRILESFAKAGVMPEDDTELLTQAYLAYRSRGHEKALLGEKAVLEGDEFSGYRRAVQALWNQYLGELPN